MEDKSYLVRFVMQTQAGAFSADGSPLVVQSPSFPGTGKGDSFTKGNVYPALGHNEGEHRAFPVSAVSQVPCYQVRARCPMHMGARTVTPTLEKRKSDLFIAEFTHRTQEAPLKSVPPRTIWGQDKFQGLWRIG